MRILDVTLPGVPGIVSFGRIGITRFSTAGESAAGVELFETSAMGDELITGLSV
jgi:hypothetical protein